MLLSLFLFTINSFRVAVPIVTLCGTAPTFFIFWSLLRMFTTVCASRRIYRRFDDYLYSMYQRSVLFFFQNWVNVKIYVHGDYEEIFKRKENALYISNHQSAVDWIITNMLAIHQGSIGHIRYVLKNELRWIPFYGFYFQQHGCIYVRRNDKGDLDRVAQGIRAIENNGLPVWLVIFPEGTRYNPIESPEVIERSREIAQQKNVEPFDHVLYPRPGATIATIKALKHKLDAVYDITVMYNKTYDSDRGIRLSAPSMIGFVLGQSPELHLDVRRIEMHQVPSDTTEDVLNWLYERFQYKDKLLKRFYEFQHSKTSESVVFTSDMNDKPMELELPLRETIFSCLFFVLTTLSLVLTERGRACYWKMCIFGAPFTLVWMRLFSNFRFHH